MDLKIATLVALIGQVIFFIILLIMNLRVISWSPAVSILINIIGSGSLIFFFIVLYMRQQKSGEKQ